MEAIRLKLPGPRPYDPGDLQVWLEKYHEWQEELKTEGLYKVDPGGGSSVNSNRAGRPTESMALNQANVAERCRVVETWLTQLDPGRRLMVEYYLTGYRMTVRQIASQLGLRYGDVAATIRILPALIYLEWYAEVEHVSNG